MTVLIIILRILLIWWLLTIILKWLTGAQKTDRMPPKSSRGGPDDLSEMPIAGDIEDADFEEIDDQ